MLRVRKYIIPALIILLILVSGKSTAQEGLRAGISAGMQNTLLRSYGRSEINVENAFCPHVSADLEYRFRPRSGIQFGLGYALYSQNTSKFRNNFNYLTMPLYLKLGGFRNENRIIALSFFGGPNLKFLVSANNLYQNEKKNITDYATNFHLDYTIGGGLMYKPGERIVLESHITTTVLGSNFNNASFDNFVLKNFNYGVVIGLKYQLTRK